MFSSSRGRPLGGVKLVAVIWSVIVELGRLFHRWIEAEILMGIFAVFMPSGYLHPHDNFVRMHFLHRAFFASSINVDSIAGLQQHFDSL